MLLIGLTGGIGAGKSTVSAMLAERGAVVIDADQVAREVVEPGMPAYDAIVARFGRGILAADGTLDRPALGRVVFADRAALKDLEGITHPAIGARMAERMAEVQETDHTVILDVPLLLEAGRYPTEGTIVVDCPVEIALERLVSIRGMTEEDARNRIAAQVSREERLARADFVITNDGSMDDLRRQVDDAWAWIEGKRAERA